MLLIAFCSGDFEAIFDEQFLNIDGSSGRRIRRLDSNFMGDFENINTLIYHKYISLNNKSCPICLCDYEEEDVLKILPNCYHTFHKECIKHWFRNQLKCPFCRVEITREEIRKEKDMTESDLIARIKHSESFIESQARRKEAEVRVSIVPDSEDRGSDTYSNLNRSKPRLVSFKAIQPKLGREQNFHQRGHNKRLAMRAAESMKIAPLTTNLIKNKDRHLTPCDLPNGTRKGRIPNNREKEKSNIIEVTQNAKHKRAASGLNDINIIDYYELESLEESKKE